jgi:predicted aspartyl protease
MNKKPGIQSSVFLVSLLTLGLAEVGVADEPAATPIPFQLYQDHLILVEGSIGPLEGLTFLIDTGASSTFLSKHIAKKLKLKGKKKRGSAYGKPVSYEQVILREFCIGSTRFRVVPAGIIDISRLPQVGSHIDAIIGLNALVRSSLTIDYQNRTITMGASTGFGSVARLDTTRLALVVHLKTKNQTLRLIVDTGANDLILYQRRLSGSVPGKRTQRQKTIYHLGAKERMKMVQLSEVQIGQGRWERVDGYLLDAPVESDEDSEGILGPTCLGFSRIHFDFRQNQVSWEL